METSQNLTSGQLARRAGVNVETLRFYERRGLLPRPRRTLANYRAYSLDAVRRVQFIKRAQQLGFSLAEIQRLLSLKAHSRSDQADVCDFAQQKIDEIDGKIASLQKMRNVLASLIEECRKKAKFSSCVILSAFEGLCEEVCDATQERR
jgi:Hg(II)-responsive transcriptional regulator